MFAKLASISLLALSVLAAPLKRQTHSGGGKVTFYTIGDSNPNFLCGGRYESEEQLIVALPYPMLINDGNLKQYCNRWITVEWQGKTVQAQVKDGCESCHGFGNNFIDLSPGAMRVLDPNYEVTGQLLGVNWWFSDDAGPSTPEPQSQSEEPKPKPSPSPTPEWTPTSVYTPPPPPTSTWSPPPPETSSAQPSATPTSTSTETSVAPVSTSALPSSSAILSVSSLNSTLTVTSANATLTASISAGLNMTNTTTILGNLTSANATSTVITVALPNSTAIAIAPDAVITTAGGDDNGNLAAFNDLVATLGRLIIAGAAA